MDFYVYHNSPRSTLVRFLCLAHQCNLSSIIWHIRPCESFGLYLVSESHKRSILIMYLTKKFLWWNRIDENKHKSFKGMPLYCCYIQHCMDLQLAVDPYKRRVLFESMDWLPKAHKVSWHISASQPNIHQRRWYDMRSDDCNFHRNQTLVGELITFLSIFGPQKLGILTARLNKSLSISTSIQWEGISVLNHAQNFHSYCKNNSFWKTLWWDMWAMMHASKVSWIGIIVFCNRNEDMPLYHIFKLIIPLLFGYIMMFDTGIFLLSLDTDYIGWKHWA